MVTIAVHIEILPLTSVTVNITSLGPKSVQSKFITSIEVDETPQLSVLPPSTSAGMIEIFPVKSNCIVMS